MNTDTKEDIVSNALEQQFLPTLAQLSKNLIAADFRLMKLVTANNIIDVATRHGKLPEKRGTIIESSSGTFGLGLALIAKKRQHKVVLVTDCLDSCLKAQLDVLGVEIHHVPPRPGVSIQHARLERLQCILNELPAAYWPEQYTNPANPESYRHTAAYLLSQLGTVDILVGSVGSGGSMSGTAAALRSFGLDIYAVGVDTPGSILFGAQLGNRKLGGLGSGMHMGNLDHTQFDEVHWVSAEIAHQHTHHLYVQHGMFKGPTSGATMVAAKWLSIKHPEKRVVAILPDDGYRYVDTVYSSDWQDASGYLRASTPNSPTEIQAPYDVQENAMWACFPWRRRSLQDVENINEVSKESI